MFVSMYIMLIIFMISTVLIMLALLFSKKTFYDREKSSPFECGFDPKSSARLPFSLQFFLIAVIFLIFDVEITILLPFTLMLKITNPLMFNLIITMFILILLIGLFHEWNQGALNWAK